MENEFRVGLWIAGLTFLALFAAVAYSAVKYTKDLTEFKAYCESVDGQTFQGRTEWVCMADGTIVRRMRS